VLACVQVGNGLMSDDEYKAHFSLWALMKAPLLIGCDVRHMSQATADVLLNTKVIAINQDQLGVQGRRVTPALTAAEEGYRYFHGYLPASENVHQGNFTVEQAEVRKVRARVRVRPASVSSVSATAVLCPALPYSDEFGATRNEAVSNI
jgi:hypothetical protein